MGLVGRIEHENRTRDITCADRAAECRVRRVIGEAVWTVSWRSEHELVGGHRPGDAIRAVRENNRLVVDVFEGEHAIEGARAGVVERRACGYNLK